MPRSLLALLTVAVLLVGSLTAADDKEKNAKPSAKPTAVTIVKVDAKKGDLTVKYTDAKGKETEKTFHLAQDVHLLDETGRVVKLDTFESGHDAVIVESDGQLRELRRTVRPHEERRLSDAVKILIEMSDCEEGCTEEVQRIYDLLRTLDTGKNGKIDPAALKAASEKILEERVDGLIKRLDTNKDGKISKEEAKGLLKEHFEKIDTNKDGFIDRDELIKAAKEKRDAKVPEKEKK